MKETEKHTDTTGTDTGENRRGPIKEKRVDSCFFVF